MGVIDISFKGGRETSQNQLLIPTDACVATSVNVWAPSGFLTKMPGMLIAASLGNSADVLGRIFTDTNASTAYSIYSRITSARGDTYFLFGALNAGGSPSVLSYTTGTVSISGASLVSATGSGTSWAAHVSGGDYFSVNSTSGVFYRISSVEDDTHLTLSSPVPVAVATGSAYRAPLQFSITAGSEASVGGSIYMSTTGDIMQRFDGSGLTRMLSAPKVAHLASFKNYVFGFRTVTADSRLYWSSVATGVAAPVSWPTNNFTDIDSGSNGGGTGLKAFGNELIVFKKFGMYKVVGDAFDPANPTFAVYPIAVPRSFRFYAPDSVVIHNSMLYFIASDGIYVYQQGTNYITRIPDAINNDLQRALNADNYAGQWQGVSYNGCLIYKGFFEGFSGALNDPTLTDHYFAIVMDRNGKWWKANNIQESTGGLNSSSPFATVPMTVAGFDSVPKQYLITGKGLVASHVYWDFGAAYTNATSSANYVEASGSAATSIAAHWRSKEFNVEYGHFKQLVVYMQKQPAGSLDVGWSIDQGSFATATADMTVGRGNLIRRTFDINQKGSTIQLYFANTASGQTFGIYAAKVYYEQILENRQA